MYGPGDSSEKIINRVIETLERGGEITLSACQQHRYFIDVDDVVEHFVEILATVRNENFDEIDIAGTIYPQKNFFTTYLQLLKGKTLL